MALSTGAGVGGRAGIIGCGAPVGRPYWSGRCAMVKGLEMQTENRFLDDLARLFAGAAGNVASLRQDLETRLREQAERLLRGMDLVSREEFAAVEAMAAKARTEQIALERRVAALEARLAEPAAAGASD